MRDEKLRQGVDVIDLGVGNPGHAAAGARDPGDEGRAGRPAGAEPPLSVVQRTARVPRRDLRSGIAADSASRSIPKARRCRWWAPRKASRSCCSRTSIPATRVLMCTPCYPGLSGRRGADAVAAGRGAAARRSNRFLPDLAAIDRDDARRAKIHLRELPEQSDRRGRDRRVLPGSAALRARERPVRRSRTSRTAISRSILRIARSRSSNSTASSERTHRVPLVLQVVLDAGLARGIRGRQSPKCSRTLLKVKSNMDFGVFMAIQRAALAVLTGPQDYCTEVSAHLPHAPRRVLMRRAKDSATRSSRRRATIYLWLPIPRRYGSSLEFTRDLLDRRPASWCRPARDSAPRAKATCASPCARARNACASSASA